MTDVLKLPKWIDDAKGKDPFTDDLIAEIIRLRAQVSDAERLDAARWRMLPAFIQEHQINYVKLIKQIDATIRSQQAQAGEEGGEG